MSFPILERLKASNRLAQAEITIEDRNAMSDRAKLMGCDITALAPGALTFKNERGALTTVPVSRILEIRLGPTVLWKRRA